MFLIVLLVKQKKKNVTLSATDPHESGVRDVEKRNTKNSLKKFQFYLNKYLNPINHFFICITLLVKIGVCNLRLL